MDQTPIRIDIRLAEDADRSWIEDLLVERWGSVDIVSRGRLHHADQLPGLIAGRHNERVGLLTYRIDGEACEVVSLDSLHEGIGVGGALLHEVEHIATKAGCKRLWLVTTNDNQRAIDYYRNRDFKLAAVHEDAVSHARRLKPEIPTHNHEGIPIRDEWEFERLL
jgi:ribosomal protein S18 acetylase RimI-like enzyme